MNPSLYDLIVHSRNPKGHVNWKAKDSHGLSLSTQTGGDGLFEWFESVLNATTEPISFNCTIEVLNYEGQVYVGPVASDKVAWLPFSTADRDEVVILKADMVRIAQASRQPLQLNPGHTIGKYTVLSRDLGAGANGRVYRVESNGKEYAMKVLHPKHVGKDREKRFQREILMLERYHDDNGVIDIHEANTTGDELPSFWYVMPLAQRLRLGTNDTRTVRKTIEMFVDIVATIGRIHAQGDTHRDLKLQNLLRIDGRFVLADFGLAHDAADDSVLTGNARNMGPMNFMAQEVYDGTVRTDGWMAVDVFGLGKLIWALCTNVWVPPPGMMSSNSVKYSLSGRGTTKSVSPIDQIVEECTLMDPEKRPLAHELEKRLRDWLSNVEA